MQISDGGENWNSSNNRKKTNVVEKMPGVEVRKADSHTAEDLISQGKGFILYSECTGKASVLFQPERGMTQLIFSRVTLLSAG